MQRTGAAWSIGWLFLLGATAGTALDQLHVYSRVERYPAPVFFGQAWWVPLLFGAAAVAIGYSHPKIDRILGNVRPRRRLLLSLSEVGWLLLMYLVSIDTLDSAAKALLLALVYLSFWFLDGRGWQNLLLSLVTVVIGTLVEMTLVAMGAFAYLHPDVAGVPYWLPCLYACASLAIGDVGRSLFSSKVKVSHAAT